MAIDGQLLAAIDSLGNPPEVVSGGTTNGAGGSGVDGSQSGTEKETQQDSELTDDMAILSAHDGSGDSLSYLGFEPNTIPDGVADSVQGEGSVNRDLVGDGAAWVTYRHRTIEWLMASAYPLEGSSDSGADRVIAGNAIGLDAYNAGLGGDLAQLDGDHHKIMLMDGMQFASIALTIGAVGWAVRAGGLLTSLLVGMPVWREFDPLPVVAEDKEKKKRVEGDEEGDTDEEELATNLLETGQFDIGARK